MWYKSMAMYTKTNTKITCRQQQQEPCKQYGESNENTETQCFLTRATTEAAKRCMYLNVP